MQIVRQQTRSFLSMGPLVNEHIEHFVRLGSVSEKMGLVKEFREIIDNPRRRATILLGGAK